VPLRRQHERTLERELHQLREQCRLAACRACSKQRRKLARWRRPRLKARVSVWTRLRPRVRATVRVKVRVRAKSRVGLGLGLTPEPYHQTPAMRESAPTTIGATSQPSRPELPCSESWDQLCGRAAALRSPVAPLCMPKKAAYNRSGCKGVAQTMSE